jgi:hypothetical protein
MLPEGMLEFLENSVLPGQALEFGFDLASGRCGVFGIFQPLARCPSFCLGLVEFCLGHRHCLLCRCYGLLCLHQLSFWVGQLDEFVLEFGELLLNRCALRRKLAQLLGSKLNREPGLFEHSKFLLDRLEFAGAALEFGVTIGIVRQFRKLAF